MTVQNSYFFILPLGSKYNIMALRGNYILHVHSFGEEKYMRSSLDSLLVLEKKYHNILNKVAQQHGLTIAEWQLLIKISDGAQTQEQLAHITKLNISTLSRQLTRLETKKFVIKSPTAGKRGRGYFVYTETEKGKETMQEMETAIKTLEQRLFMRWSDEETKLLQVLLNRLVQSMKRFD